MHGTTNPKKKPYYLVHILVIFSSFGWFSRIKIAHGFTERLLRAEITFIIKQIFICEIIYSFPCQIVLFFSEHKAEHVLFGGGGAINM
jgi:hypothetical protein